MSPAAKKRFKISKDFSRTPGPRNLDEGDWSGEELREKHFIPLIEEAIRSEIKLLIDLDGTAGYGTSFLEEAFGGLVRNNHYCHAKLREIFEFKSNEEPYLIDDIWDYIIEAEEKSHNGTN